MRAYTPAASTFNCPITNLLTVLCIFIQVLSCGLANGGEKKKSLNDFKFGTFSGCFRHDGAANMAVKGLILSNHILHQFEILVAKSPVGLIHC